MNEYGLVNPKVELTNEKYIELNNEFIEALSDDFNVSNAMTTLDKVIKEVNNAVRQKDVDANLLSELYSLYYGLLWVLGIEPHIDALNDSELNLVKKWNEARANKDFALADALRQEINDKGIIL